MRTPRIHTPAPLACGGTIELDGDAANHIARVLRSQTGAPLVLFNGAGGEYEAIIEHIGKRTVTARIAAHHARECESPLDIWLAQGISRGERMDYTVQKAVELGVHRIIPLFTERCGVELSGERLRKRVQHWQAIVTSACEQCGRNRVPHVEMPQQYSAWVMARTPIGTLKLALDPQATHTLSSLSPPAGPVILLIGPEGGLSGAELQHAQRMHFTGLRLGPRVLRTETAALTALASMQTLWGDLGKT